MAAAGNPPPRMTWAKASLVLAFALIFDALRAFFVMFWFFAPLIVGVGVAAYVGSYFGTTVGDAAGAAATAVSGVFGAPALAAFGIVMSLLMGFLGWLVVGFLMLITNRRIFKEEPINSIWYIGSILQAETPFINSIPGLTIITGKMYYTQIKKEKKAYKKWLATSAPNRIARQREVASMLRANREQQQFEEVAPQEEESDDTLRENYPSLAFTPTDYIEADIARANAANDNERASTQRRAA